MAHHITCYHSAVSHGINQAVGSLLACDLVGPGFMAGLEWYECLFLSNAPKDFPLKNALQFYSIFFFISGGASHSQGFGDNNSTLSLIKGSIHYSPNKLEWWLFKCQNELKFKSNRDHYGSHQMIMEWPSAKNSIKTYYEAYLNAQIPEVCRTSY